MSQLDRDPQTNSITFTHVTVIDSTGAPAKPEMIVVITGNRITAIGRVGETTVPKDSRVIDAAGKFLIPGLWDMHAHIFNQISQRPPNVWHFPLFVANGVVGVREMWTKPQDMDQVFEWRKQFGQGCLTIPRVAAVGILLDGPEFTWPNSDVVATAEDARRTVRRIKEVGADFVKTYSNLSREAYFAIADEAGKLNIPFAGHVPTAVGADEASVAGQRSMEHLNQVLETCSTSAQKLLTVPGKDWGSEHDKLMLDTYDEAKCLKLFAQFVRNDIWHVPTLINEYRHRFHGDVRYFTEDTRLKYVPAHERNWWMNHVARQSSVSDDERQIRQRHWQLIITTVGAMHRAGVKFMTGTDVGNAFVFPGFSVHDELGLFVRAGLSPMEALQTATRNPAQYLGLLDSHGTIEEGKIADMVLLDADPLRDITNTRRIQAVVLNGRLVTKEQLDKMLAEAEATASGK